MFFVHRWSGAAVSAAEMTVSYVKADSDGCT